MGWPSLVMRSSFAQVVLCGHSWGFEVAVALGQQLTLMGLTLRGLVALDCRSSFT